MFVAAGAATAIGICAIAFIRPGRRPLGTSAEHGDLSAVPPT
jgi:hypothetical protein